MLLATFNRLLANLAVGESLTLSREQCDDLFWPGPRTVEGRGRMYAVANASDCDVHWIDGESIGFRKR